MRAQWQHAVPRSQLFCCLPFTFVASTPALPRYFVDQQGYMYMPRSASILTATTGGCATPTPMQWAETSSLQQQLGGSSPEQHVGVSGDLCHADRRNSGYGWATSLSVADSIHHAYTRSLEETHLSTAAAAAASTSAADMLILHPQSLGVQHHDHTRRSHNQAPNKASAEWELLHQDRATATATATAIATATAAGILTSPWRWHYLRGTCSRFSFLCL